MLDWLVDIQYPNGSIQGGRIDSSPRVPVTFNTGQVLLGLAAGVVEFGDRYRDAMNRAATWLRDSLDPDGCWRRYPTPFAIPGEKAYETHVSWGLFEAARVEANRGYGEAGLKQVDWALTKQRANGWFADCCLVDPSNPLTHTIAYALRGVIEAYRFSQDRRYLMAARETADRIIGVMSPDGHLAGRFDANWRPKVKWVCLTGTAQMAACWFILHRITGELRYRAAALKANEFVRRTVSVSGPPEIRGGVKGSFPVDGDYGRFEYLSWAAKFCADANMMELGIDREAISHSAPATAHT
jgi:hypothetical protein